MNLLRLLSQLLVIAALSHVVSAAAVSPDPATRKTHRVLSPSANSLPNIPAKNKLRTHNANHNNAPRGRTTEAQLEDETIITPADLAFIKAMEELEEIEGAALNNVNAFDVEDKFQLRSTKPVYSTSRLAEAQRRVNAAAHKLMSTWPKADDMKRIALNAYNNQTARKAETDNIEKAKTSNTNSASVQPPAIKQKKLGQLSIECKEEDKTPEPNEAIVNPSETGSPPVSGSETTEATAAEREAEPTSATLEKTVDTVAAAAILAVPVIVKVGSAGQKDEKQQTSRVAEVEKKLEEAGVRISARKDAPLADAKAASRKPWANADTAQWPAGGQGTTVMVYQVTGSSSDDNNDNGEGKGDGEKKKLGLGENQAKMKEQRSSMAKALAAWDAADRAKQEEEEDSQEASEKAKKESEKAKIVSSATESQGRSAVENKGDEQDEEEEEDKTEVLVTVTLRTGTADEDAQIEDAKKQLKEVKSEQDKKKLIAQLEKMKEEAKKLEAALAELGGGSAIEGEPKKEEEQEGTESDGAADAVAAEAGKEPARVQSHESIPARIEADDDEETVGCVSGLLSCVGQCVGGEEDEFKGFSVEELEAMIEVEEELKADAERELVTAEEWKSKEEMVQNATELGKAAKEEMVRAERAASNTLALGGQAGGGMVADAKSQDKVRAARKKYVSELRALEQAAKAVKEFRDDAKRKDDEAKKLIEDEMSKPEKPGLFSRIKKTFKREEEIEITDEEVQKTWLEKAEDAVAVANARIQQADAELEKLGEALERAKERKSKADDKLKLAEATVAAKAEVSKEMEAQKKEMQALEAAQQEYLEGLKEAQRKMKDAEKKYSVYGAGCTGPTWSNSKIKREADKAIKAARKQYTAEIKALEKAKNQAEKIAKDQANAYKRVQERAKKKVEEQKQEASKEVEANTGEAGDDNERYKKAEEERKRKEAEEAAKKQAEEEAKKKAEEETQKKKQEEEAAKKKKEEEETTKKKEEASYESLVAQADEAWKEAEALAEKLKTIKDANEKTKVQREYQDARVKAESLTNKAKKAQKAKKTN